MCHPGECPSCLSTQLKWHDCVVGTKFNAPEPAGYECLDCGEFISVNELEIEAARGDVLQEFNEFFDQEFFD